MTQPIDPRLMNTQPIPPGGGAVPVPVDMQYPLDDPQAAVRNYLRSVGLMGNPFNPAANKMVDYYAGGAVPGFLAQLMSSGQSGWGMQVGDEFKKFLASWIGGGGSSSLGQAQANVEGGSKLLSDVAQKIAGYADKQGKRLDMSNPAAVKALADQGMISGDLSPLQRALAGFIGSPQQQMQFYLGSMLPALGPALTKGLATSSAPVEQGWNDYGASQATTDPRAQFMSLLDMLLGHSPRDTVGAMFSRPPGAAGVE